MKFPLAWIAEYTELPPDEEAVARAYTLSGSEVEGRDVLEGESVLDFGITVNRPDCMNVYGLAREASVLFGKSLRPVQTACREEGPPIADLTSVSIEAPGLCPRYVARVITGVKVGESPAWMQKRLLQCGLRPINAVVDITNFVLMELGHPLHAFDMDTLAQKRIVVRRAVRDEKITTLDGVERALNPDRLVIADARRPVAIAGVMGGEDTGVIYATKNVLLEGAVFDPVSIRRTSKALALRTDASHRFERGVDFEGPLPALDRCARFILEICGGVLAKGLLDVCPAPRKPEAVRLRHSRLASLVGLEIPADRCVGILKALGFAVEAAGNSEWRVAPPSFRVDVSREADLIEEVVRIYGLQDLQPALPSLVDPVGGTPREQDQEEILRDALVACGLTECIHMSMTAPEVEKVFGTQPEPIALSNPLSPQSSVLRTSLLGPMAACAARNRARGARRVDLFELGRVYIPSGDRLPAEERRVAILTYADEPPARWGNSEPQGLLHLKGQVETALGKLGLETSFEPAEKAPFAKGLCLRVFGGGQILGHLGTVAPEALESLGLKSGFAHAAQIVLDGLESLAAEPAFQPLSRFPAVTRDFSFLVDDGVRWGDILEKLRGLSVKDLVGIHLVGCYTGKEIPEGRRSWTFSLVLQARDRTLSEEDTAPIASLVAGAMQEAFRAVQR